MAEVHDTDAALDVIARRGSAVAVIFSRLGEGVPLPLAAHELAQLGVPVFPCVPGGKRPITTRGLHEATTDAAQVVSWWRQRPAANLAIPTGAASGLVVVDIDVHKVDGYVAARNAARSELLPEPLAVVTTPTGGRHLYFPAVAEHEQRSWQVGLAGIDFRGDGGYIIVPPSQRMVDGRRMQYRVESVAAGPVACLDAQRLRHFLDPRPKYTTMAAHWSGCTRPSSSTPSWSRSATARSPTSRSTPRSASIWTVTRTSSASGPVMSRG